MGRKSGTETIIGIFHAFTQKRRWRQAELARHLEITVPSLRARLAEVSSHLPLTDVREHPDVFWTVPAGWNPGGFDTWFQEIADFPPHEWQRELARDQACRDRLLRIPTGFVAKYCGKTAPSSCFVRVDTHPHGHDCVWGQPRFSTSWEGLAGHD